MNILFYLIFIQKESWELGFPDSYLKFLTTTFLILDKLLKKNIVIRKVDQKMSTINLITQHFTLNFAEISIFQVVRTSFIKSISEKKATKSSK